MVTVRSITGSSLNDDGQMTTNSLLRIEHSSHKSKKNEEHKK